MKNGYLNLIIAILVLSGLSCEKMETPPDPPAEPKEIFELVWETPLDTTKSVININDGKVYKDWYLFTGDSDNSATIMAYNTKTGHLDWTYDHRNEVFEVSYSLVYDNIYIAKTHREIFALNMDTQELMWEINTRDLNFTADNNSIIDDGFLYQHGTKNLDEFNSIRQIYKINVLTGEKEIIYSVPRTSEGSISTSTPAFYTDNNTGHKVMIMNRYPNPTITPPEAQQDILAIDLATNEVLWENNDFTQKYPSNHFEPIIYNDLVITGGDYSLYAFDIHTGEQKWKTSVPGLDRFGIWQVTHHLLHKNRLFVNPIGFELLCIDPATGDIIWKTDDAPNCSKHMVYYEKEDYLVFTSWGYASVMAVDALTGETIVREYKHKGSQYNNDTVYDPETDMFFSSTYKHAVGFKINHKEQ